MRTNPFLDGPSPHYGRNQILSFRKKTRIPCTVVGKQIIRNTHHRPLVFFKLIFKEMGVKIVEDIPVPKHDAVDGVVLSHYL